MIWLIISILNSIKNGYQATREKIRQKFEIWYGQSKYFLILKSEYVHTAIAKGNMSKLKYRLLSKKQFVHDFYSQRNN